MDNTPPKNHLPPELAAQILEKQKQTMFPPVPPIPMPTLGPEASIATFWSLTEGDALSTLRILEVELSKVGWHVALTGSVLQKGGSHKDLDVVVYPHKKKNSHCPAKKSLHAALRRLSLEQRLSHKQLRKLSPKDGSKRDKKWVEVWQTEEGRRIDFLVLS